MSGVSTGTALAISAAVALATTAASTYAASQQAQQQRQAQEHQRAVQQAQADYQGEIAQKNQDLADEQARAQRREGYQNMVKKRQETAKLVGAQRAKSGASGAVVDFGSNLDLNMDTMEQGEFDALAEYQKGLNAAYGSEIQKWNYGQQAAGYDMQSQAAASTPIYDNSTLAAVTTGVSGLGKVVDLWGVGKRPWTDAASGNANPTNIRKG